MPTQSGNSYTTLLNAARSERTRRLMLLGASGSIGSSTLRYLAMDCEIELIALSVHRSIATLPEMIAKFKPRLVCISDSNTYKQNINQLKKDWPVVQFFEGQQGMLTMLQEAVSDYHLDTVLTAVVGAIGIEVTMLAISLGLKIALANKETMVTAGPVIATRISQMREQNQKLPVIMPVDSEHNAIFQLLLNLPAGHLNKIILTASGGPFRNLALDELQSVSRDQVLNHPTWSMGPKITVDSAGMINKGLELIEARYLFDVSYDHLDALIHPDSIVHGLISSHDGGYLFCASQPDMTFPIAHSLCYPQPVLQQHPSATQPVDWPALQFFKVEKERYPGFDLSIQAGRAGKTAPAIFNAANETAVEAFLEDRISFVQIPQLIAQTLDGIELTQSTELADYLEADRRAREYCRNLII